jgi:hypothetical protein
MKYPNLVPTEEPETEPTVDPRDAEIERLHAEALDRERRDAANEARLEMMERRLGEGYQANQSAPTAPDASPSYQAQQELGITDEELLANPTQSMRQIAEHVAAKMNAESMQRVGAVVGNLANTTYEMELKELSTHPYYVHLEGQLRDHFRNNPTEYTNNPGAMRRKYNELVGANLTDLQRIQEEATEADISNSTNAAPATRTPSRTRVVEPNLPVNSPAPGNVRGTKKEAPVLDSARQELMDTFNAFGLNMNAEEWLEIEEGRALPKKVSADIQVGIAKSNVDY